MQIDSPAIVLTLLAHGEHGVIARLLTPADGMIAGYVRGGRSRRLRPVLMPGNIVQATFRARSEAQLAQLGVELLVSRAPLMLDRLPAAAVDWATTLTAALLPEGQPYPAIHGGLDGLLAAIEAAPAARGWGAALVRYEALLLAELGFGLDLNRCVATGATDDLAFVSPKSAAAVSRAAGLPYADRLLPLPAFLVDGTPTAGWADIAAGLRLTGHFLSRDLLAGRHAAILATRARLADRIARLA